MLLGLLDYYAYNRALRSANLVLDGCKLANFYNNEFLLPKYLATTKTHDSSLS